MRDFGSLAAKERKSQQWISRRMLFGRFLSFTPTGVNAETLPINLGEWRFRSYWDRTDKFGGNERGGGGRDGMRRPRA
jgi:hypothetical protein